MSNYQKKEKDWMSIEKSIQRLSWRFGNGNFTPNQNDINALNGIIEWVNDQRKITLNQNHLFAKLYIYYLNQFIDKYQTTVFDTIPQKELSKLLDTPLDLFYEAFQRSLNSNKLMEVLQDNGVELKHPELRTEQELKENSIKLKNINKDDIVKITEDSWTKEEVEANLNKMVTEALNRFQ